MFQYGKANATFFKRIKMTNSCNSSQWIIDKKLDFFGQFNDILFKTKIKSWAVYKTTIFLY